MGKLDNNVALVTGAGRGIGRELALKLANDGASVVVNDLDDGPANETVAAIRSDGGRAAECAGSVTADGFAEKFIETALSEFGGVDIIVNNAGYFWGAPLHEMTDEQWTSMFDIHVTAPFKIIRAAHPVIAKAVAGEAGAGSTPRRRKIVNVTSLAGQGGLAGHINYSAAKSAVFGMSRAAAKELAPLQVNVNSVAFGYVETRLVEASAEQQTILIEGKEVPIGTTPQEFAMISQLIPFGRAGTAEEAAGAIYLLCLPESNYITGETLICGGGIRV